MMPRDGTKVHSFIFLPVLYKRERVYTKECRAHSFSPYNTEKKIKESTTWCQPKPTWCVLLEPAELLQNVQCPLAVLVREVEEVHEQPEVVQTEGLGGDGCGTTLGVHGLLIGG